jgi:hypothetical protein
MKVDDLQVSVQRIKKVPKIWPPANTAHLRASVNEIIDVCESI